MVAKQTNKQTKQVSHPTKDFLSPAVTCLCISSTCLCGMLFRMVYISDSFSSGITTDALFGKRKTKNIIHLFKNKTKHGHWQFIDWYEPFPVKYFRKWQNVGVSKDDGDTTSLQHVTEGSLAQTSPPQHHAERGFLYVHNGSVKTTQSYTKQQGFSRH